MDEELRDNTEPPQCKNIKYREVWYTDMFLIEESGLSSIIF